VAEIDLSLHGKQTVAYESDATEILYGGAAGGGKSHLLRVAAIAWCATIPGLQVYLFRRLSPDLLKNHMEGVTGFPALLSNWVDAKHCKINYSSNEIKFWNGAKIFLCHCQHEKDMYKYQGVEMNVLLIDELTHFSEKIFRFLRSRVRLGGLVIAEQFKHLFPRIIAGSNPGGIGHNWVRSTFVQAAQPLQIVKQSQKDGGMMRQFIPAKLEDNPTLTENDPDYSLRLDGLGDAAMVKAMRDGDWNIVSGGAFDDVWREDKIIKPRFKIPSSWRVDRSFDWGSSHPFSVLWWAESDGTEAKTMDGGIFCAPKGSLILIEEWYGSKGGNEGLKMAPLDVAKGILSRDDMLINAGWITSRPKAGPADNQICDVRDPSTPTIADEMKKVGVYWTRSDKTSGSRKIGLELMRSRIKEACKDLPENPALYIMANCVNVATNWPVLPRDPKNTDDVDTKAVDHDYDAGRYRVLAGKQTAMSISMTTSRNY
jgi:hypothetical protein